MQRLKELQSTLPDGPARGRAAGVAARKVDHGAELGGRHLDQQQQRLIGLWRLVREGVVPDGVVLRPVS
jgi:hypothetical protein